MPDECELAAGTSEDCQPNGIPDDCDLDDCAPGEPDCQDCNNDDIPDGCQVLTGGDFDANGHLELVDYQALAMCLAGPGISPTPPNGECVPGLSRGF